MNAVFSALAVALVFAAYFFPTIVASRRGHRNANAVCAVNLFFGWTFVGWVVALVWSLTDNTTRKTA